MIEPVGATSGGWCDGEQVVEKNLANANMQPKSSKGTNNPRHVHVWALTPELKSLPFA